MNKNTNEGTTMTRLLPWSHYDEDHWDAETKVEAYCVQQHDYRDGTTAYEASCGNEWPRDLGVFNTPDAAMTACESDYLARCTEFLRVAGAGEIIVTRAAVYPIVKVVCGGCGFAGSMSNPRCAQDCFYRPLYDQFKAQTAAIDVAGGGR